MTTLLTTTPTRGTITNINQPADPSGCGLNETGICCKESDTAHQSFGWIRVKVRLHARKSRADTGLWLSTLSNW